MKIPKDNSLRTLTIGLLVVLVFGFFATDWLRFLVQMSLATFLVVLGVMLQMRAGLVSFGQGLFYCLGAYVAGMAGYFWGVTDVFLLLFAGTTACVVLSVGLGFLLVRYRGIFYANFSLALSMILYGLLVKAEVLGSTDGFNVPHSTFFGFAPEGETLKITVFVLTCVIVYLVAFVLHRYLKSTYGYMGDAVRQNEIRVEYLGASVRSVIHRIYVIAAAISGIGGVLTAVAVGHVDPDLAYWTTSGEFVFVALLSGTANVMAPIVGAFLLELLRTYAFEYAPYTWQMILGVTMLMVILFLLGGIWSIGSRRRAGK
ncbi:ABC transporter, permease protein 2 (cluster 4, leucine/isoleucine/valine/benzoate) [Olavius algarvensis Delta 1 endosymbiont]|nr:ABC transporter, permease protein 2 (cluster 4, leucine/isoleucine/valine/benzoate) [Olavius algarvensis Delta 1 endosymbiont]